MTKTNEAKELAKQMVLDFLVEKMDEQNNWGGDWGCTLEAYEANSLLREKFGETEWFRNLDFSEDVYPYWDDLPEEAKEYLEENGFGEYGADDNTEYLKQEAESIFYECEDLSFVDERLVDFDFDDLVKYVEKGEIWNLDEYLEKSHLENAYKTLRRFVINEVSDEYIEKRIKRDDKWKMCDEVILDYKESVAKRFFEYAYDDEEDIEYNERVAKAYMELEEKNFDFLEKLLNKKDRLTPYKKNLDGEEVDPDFVEKVTRNRLDKLCRRDLSDEEMSAILSGVYDREGDFELCEEGGDFVIRDVLNDCGLLREAEFRFHDNKRLREKYPDWLDYGTWNF